MAVKPPLDEKRLIAERRQDVLLLLQHLVRHEETTVKLILECLYDIGAIKLIDRKVTMQPANRVVKKLARLSRPAFRIYALRWFQKNCPELIANWLYGKVEAAVAPPNPQSPLPPIAEAAKEAIPGPPAVPVPPPQAEIAPGAAESAMLSGEVRQLRNQVKLLTGTLVLAIAALGATVVWMGTDVQLEVLRLVRSEQEQAPLSPGEAESNSALCAPTAQPIQAIEAR